MSQSQNKKRKVAPKGKPWRKNDQIHNSALRDFKNLLIIELRDIPGIGPKRIELLETHIEKVHKTIKR